MPSDWTMRTSRRHAPESGFLLLLLFILALHGLKALFTFRDAGESPIDEKIFVQITGDIPCPGVYGFSRVPHPTQLLLRAGGKGQASKSGFSFGTSTLHSGQSVDVRTDTPGSRSLSARCRPFTKSPSEYRSPSTGRHGRDSRPSPGSDQN